MISFEVFRQLELKVAKITSAERISGSDKLVKLSLDIGAEPRTIVAGISKRYEPETLVGREIVIVVNLEPKKFIIKSESGDFELESQGMLLAANDDGPVLLTPDREVPPGSLIS